MCALAIVWDRRGRALPSQKKKKTFNQENLLNIQPTEQQKHLLNLVDALSSLQCGEMLKTIRRTYNQSNKSTSLIFSKEMTGPLDVSNTFYVVNSRRRRRCR